MFDVIFVEGTTAESFAMGMSLVASKDELLSRCRRIVTETMAVTRKTAAKASTTQMGHRLLGGLVLLPFRFGCLDSRRDSSWATGRVFGISVPGLTA